MRKQCILLILIFVGLFAYAQPNINDCFGPVDGSTIYFSNSPDFSTSLIGFTNYLPINDGFAGNWSIVNPSTGAGLGASFALDGAITLDNGSTASIDVVNPGSLVINNQVQDATGAFIGQCTQTYNLVEYSRNRNDNPDYSPDQNPATIADCTQRILFIVDESGSIFGPDESTIESGIQAFVSGLITNGAVVEMAFVEFESTARNVPINGSTSYQIVDAAFEAGVNSYLSASSSLGNLITNQPNPQDPNSYTPGEDVDDFIGGTNWQDALLKAQNLPPADLVIFLSDGNPTFYNNSPQPLVAGEGDVLDMTALTLAQLEANTIKAFGSHIFFLGVGDNISLLENPIIELNGDDIYALGGTEAEFCIADYALSPMSDISNCFIDLASKVSEKQNCPVIQNSIPTTSEWSLLILCLILLNVGVLQIKQSVLSPIQTS